MELKVRLGTHEDAQQAVIVLRRSITELCAMDHHNDPAEVDGWLRNKTEAAWRGWLTQPNTMVFVAERRSRIVGVGMVTCDGIVLLNYVHPDARYSGVSKALLTVMEAEAVKRGANRCTLESTKTSEAFYRHQGYAPARYGTSERILIKIVLAPESAPTLK